jgi:hypothetical protein
VKRGRRDKPRARVGMASGRTRGGEESRGIEKPTETRFVWGRQTAGLSAVDMGSDGVDKKR